MVDAALRKNMGEAARNSAWKFERNVILQQMAEHYKVGVNAVILIILMLPVCL